MLGVFLMLLAACCNAGASVLQRRAGRDEPESAEFSFHMFLDLARRPAWLFGVLTMLTGFVVHGVAISVSRIALVQPLLIAELPLTLLLAARVFHLRLRRLDVLAIGLDTVGLAAFVYCLAPYGGDPYQTPPFAWIVAGAATIAAVGVLIAIGLRCQGDRRAAVLAVATGIFFGFNSSLIAGVGAAVSHGTMIFAAWQTYGVAVVGPASFFLLQQALAAGSLVASQPGLTLANPLVAVVWGLTILGEKTRGLPWIAGAVVGGLAIVAGTILLARSPLLSDDDSGDKGGGADEGNDDGGDGPPAGDPPNERSHVADHATPRRPRPAASP